MQVKLSSEVVISNFLRFSCTVRVCVAFTVPVLGQLMATNAIN
jgi:hypothetical protein